MSISEQVKELSTKQGNENEEKIKVSSAEIVVHGSIDKPYYEIKYYDLSDRQYHIGYSSYDLNNVFRWREECFEIIESLSAKLQAENMERSERHYNGDIFTEILENLDKRIGTQLKIIAGLNDEKQRYGYIKALDAYQQIKTFIEITLEENKEKRLSTDCCCGWIPCKNRLPEVEKTVLLSHRSLDISVGFRANTDGYFYTESEGYVLHENVLAWRDMPEPYHEL